MYGKYTKALHSRQIELEAAQKKFDEANRKLTEGRRAVKQLQAAQARALPARRPGDRRTGVSGALPVAVPARRAGRRAVRPGPRGGWPRCNIA